MSALVRIENLEKRFDISGGFLEQLKFESGRVVRRRTVVKAVNGVSFEIAKGETLSVVGESGCGKSTLARAVIGLHAPSAGEVWFDGERIDTLTPKAMRPYRKRMQMVFQDPYASLNPRLTVRSILEEPVRMHFPGLSDAQVRERVAQVMRQVGLDPAWAGNYPHEFSGGQRQRVSIARALTVDPDFIVADEPISALDVSIQAQILNLLMEAQDERGLTYLFISHDLSVVRHISTRVAVMYLGCLCELAGADALFEEPRHPYTRALLSAIPRLGADPAKRVRLTGEIPSPIHLPGGCVFHGRCPSARERCRMDVPKALDAGDGRLTACHGVEEGWV
ncbi:Oligopeptide transport ATP-binding protein OppF [Fundidesulfovibrio magnetotacticus]|uniref:Oligopeptide transport ATP-binding protein OppF n=1 Tax=Fundidesulfovibrio magnetotacticus TaxID=2730080 RepID=A0A6V8LQI6_9BACT|nr:oligopeptide/dipeptide ABC transporter ATP-binding protein [Fundidesulfovibrio magnetotacticus]GFK93230.1 Oligopeptide transport ATP-binding protein OppF [Fundidesulfovibrio magnetotacticus]